jgi:probable inorganic polyphosphate/ATP-NAD kinase
LLNNSIYIITFAKVTIIIEMTKQMAEQHLKFAIFGNEYQAKKSVSIETILAFLEKKKAEIYVENAYYDFLVRDLQLDVKVAGVFEDYNFDVDYVISMGGDGTFLKAASKVGAKGTPIIGINMGRLGFLADVLPSEIETALDSLYAGECQIEEHAVIQVEARGGVLAGNPFALNDIAVLKRDDASMISIRTHVDGEFLVTYQADGLIVTTPTGSTAYNLSNGGPIIIPQSGSLCLTPVAPHSLNIRPIVINDTAEIQLDIESRSHNYLVAIDGRSERMTEEISLVIRKAAHSIKIVKQRNQRYFSTLREKLMWGADQRER